MLVNYCKKIFYYLFMRGGNWEGEERVDYKVPFSREGSRRLEFWSVVTIKCVQRYMQIMEGEGEES